MRCAALRLSLQFPVPGVHDERTRKFSTPKADRRSTYVIKMQIHVVILRRIESGKGQSLPWKYDVLEELFNEQKYFLIANIDHFCVLNR